MDLEDEAVSIDPEVLRTRVGAVGGRKQNQELQPPSEQRRVAE